MSAALATTRITRRRVTAFQAAIDGFDSLSPLQIQLPVANAKP